MSSASHNSSLEVIGGQNVEEMAMLSVFTIRTSEQGRSSGYTEALYLEWPKAEAEISVFVCVLISPKLARLSVILSVTRQFCIQSVLPDIFE